MADFWTILTTALVTLAATYLAYWLTGKPRLVVFSPNSAWFELKPTQNGSQPFAIKAGQIIVQNSGRQSATKLQLTAQPGLLPWGYTIIPNMDHQVRTGARGEWIMEIPYLGPGETVTVQVLNGPVIDSVRSAEGPAKAVPVMHQRIFPKWFNVTALMFMIVGAITVAYGGYILAAFLLRLDTAP